VLAHGANALQILIEMKIEMAIYNNGSCGAGALKIDRRAG